MPIILNDEQKLTVEQIIDRLEVYLDARYKQVYRVNQKIAAVWDDLLWQQMAQMRLSLSGDKPFGPERFVVADLLMGDDVRKIRDLFNPVSQSSLLGEIVEQKDEKGVKTTGTLEIHDMRSLYQAIDPSVQSIVQLIQTFMWWDLEDASELARFDRKALMVEAASEGEVSPEQLAAYKERLKTERNILPEDIVRHEIRQLKHTVESFRARRLADKGYQLIIVREQSSSQTDPDVLIGVLAQENNLLKHLKSGKDVDANVKGQFAKALGVEAAEVTPQRMIPYLDQRIHEHKGQLRNSLNGQVSGRPVDMKRAQLAELEERYAQLIEGREPAPTHA